MAVVTITGRASLSTDDGSVREPLALIDALWLGRLALDGPQRRDALAQWCWPLVPSERALGSLRQRLHRLRRRWPTLVVDEDSALKLDAGVTVDAGLSAEAEAESDVAAADGPARELLQGVDPLLRRRAACSDWVQAARRNWQRQQLDAWAAKADTLEHGGQWIDALRLARRALHLDPHDALWWHRLIRLQRAAGDRAGAQAAWAQARQALASRADEPWDAALLALGARVEEGGAPGEPGSGLDAPLVAMRAPEPDARQHQALLRLGPLARSLMRCVSLSDDAYSLERAAAMLKVPLLDLAEPLAELQAAGWLDADGRAAGPACIEAARASVPEPLRRSLHAQFAQVLRADAAPAQIEATHWAAARRWPEAARAWQRAEAEADRQGRRHAALAHNDEAAQAWRQAGDSSPAFAAASRALQRAHTLEPATELAARCDALEALSTSSSQRLSSLLHRCRVAVAQADHVTAAGLAQRAAELAQALGEAAAERAAVGWGAVAQACTGRVLAALASLEPHAAAWASDAKAAPGTSAQPHGAHLREQLDFLGCYGWVLHAAGRFAEAGVPLQGAADIAEVLGDPGEQLEQLSNLAVCASSAGDRPREMAMAERVLALWQRLGEPECLAADTARVQLATACMSAGRYAQSLAMLEEVLPRLSRPETRSWHLIASHRVAHLWLRLGQPLRALKALPPLQPTDSAGARVARALVMAQLEPPTREGRAAALGLLAQAHAAHADGLDATDRHSLALGLAAVEPDEACLERCAGLIAEAAAGRGLAAVARSAHLRRAERLVRRGSLEEAAAELQALGFNEPVPLFRGIEDLEVCRLVAAVAGAIAAAGGPNATAANALAGKALAAGSALADSIQADLPRPLRDDFARCPPVQALRRMKVSAHPATPGDP